MANLLSVTPRTSRRAVPESSERIKCLKSILETMGSDPSGPIYQGTNKQLAEVLLQTGNEEEAGFHLCESHGTTLRNQMLLQIEHKLLKSKSDQLMLDKMKEKLRFKGPWHDGFRSLQKRLSELPSEWTILQLTLEWDPMSRFLPRNRDVNRGLGVYLTRLSCGELCKKKNDLGEGGSAMSVFLPALDENVEQLSLMTAMRNNLSLLDNNRRKGRRENRREVHDQCSLRIESTVQELQGWVGGWQCLFLGRLINQNLRRAIKSAVDAMLASYNEDDEKDNTLQVKPICAKKSKAKLHISEKALSFLYLLASSPSMSRCQIIAVSLYLLGDEKLASYMGYKIHDIISSYSDTLRLAKRHPVVLIIDEELDILPFEVMSAVEDQSFSRMPSIHFLHAMYDRHKNSEMLTSGIDTQKGYYVINPSKDLPQLGKLFENISANTAVQKWKGIFQTLPSKEEFLSGLQENELFWYCGHGGGNQFLPIDHINKSEIKAAVFLFGCSSNSLQQLGGRVEMTSISYSYLMSGSPCVVGMLWNVLDIDINAMTAELVNVWCTVKEEETVNELDRLEGDLKEMTIDTAKKKRQLVNDLGEAVTIVRRCASRFLNRAALVVRGLPLSAKRH